ncbi:glycosyl hydrolase family 3 C-terminal domain-containing protein [Aspergillus terricola var. indicus]
MCSKPSLSPVVERLYQALTLEEKLELEAQNERMQGGIVMAWYQGQENGQALAQALLGHCNFSGKLPITFSRRLEDHSSHSWPGEAAQDCNTFGEEVLVGYRHFDAHGVSPLWAFGF